MKILIFGCTGLVGKTLIKILTDRRFPYDDILLVASDKNVGKTFKMKNFQKKIISIEKSLNHTDINIVFMCSSAEIVSKWYRNYLELNPYLKIIDNSSYFLNLVATKRLF